ncbi:MULTISPECIES: hypothetical protein [Streptomycetaceae]|uniref:Uncharacterized protein n=1 Tax=Streptantibioticus cattleyicolor (strain ATCC 35852 / DSM 46488 / JCM 4925 / NBRC 14057 / NRRL 8057) TaxID=1003195 RepID=F8JNU6_STREN|nr:MULTISPECIES: hypothetical protein [Streptomycetaceae]AEW92677.1 hypothetical protein SCATT_03060 [Streptantibioticus cattleyicolor NRRL 8057 = DSM 46488]MYS57447.1 hypothetical protein [Streptomyces sp. SID5468]CCB73035.1 exported protein of unknown function [Streptantibioticus cattleyicolor NRRL 8057 = DSM 46488]
MQAKKLVTAIAVAGAAVIAGAPVAAAHDGWDVHVVPHEAKPGETVQVYDGDRCHSEYASAWSEAFTGEARLERARHGLGGEARIADVKPGEYKVVVKCGRHHDGGHGYDHGRDHGYDHGWNGGSHDRDDHGREHGRDHDHGRDNGWDGGRDEGREHGGREHGRDNWWDGGRDEGRDHGGREHGRDHGRDDDREDGHGWNAPETRWHDKVLYGTVRVLAKPPKGPVHAGGGGASTVNTAEIVAGTALLATAAAGTGALVVRRRRDGDSV